MQHEVYVHGFSSFEDFEDLSCAKRYSRMKFGSDVDARGIGYEMAQALWDRHSDLLLANEVCVIPSPYNYVKNAATVVTEHMINRLNCLLVDANGSHVEYSTIHRKVSYIADYGFLPKEKREALLSNDKFYVNKKFLKGKLLIFVDDIKITGTHEDKIKEILRREKMTNDVIFIYSARYYGSNPEIEAQLNFAAVSTIQDYAKLSRTADHHLLVRPIKFLLKQDFVDFVDYIESMTYKDRMNLYQAG